eukprot:4478327-Lingulodinium_polyedra.AAC.1
MGNSIRPGGVQRSSRSTQVQVPRAQRSGSRRSMPHIWDDSARASGHYPEVPFAPGCAVTAAA